MSEPVGPAGGLMSRSDPKPSADALSNAEIRRIWREAGGGFHGPHVEHAYMEEAKFLPFMRAFAARRVVEATDQAERHLAILGIAQSAKLAEARRAALEEAKQIADKYADGCDDRSRLPLEVGAYQAAVAISDKIGALIDTPPAEEG
jgi:hypothetical protein